MYTAGLGHDEVPKLVDEHEDRDQCDGRENVQDSSKAQR
jgi:hypothetical protein